MTEVTKAHTTVPKYTELGKLEAGDVFQTLHDWEGDIEIYYLVMSHRVLDESFLEGDPPNIGVQVLYDETDRIEKGNVQFLSEFKEVKEVRDMNVEFVF